MNTHEQRIREFAYQIWESEGRPCGHSDRHWVMACKLAEAHAGGDMPTPASEPIEPISPGQPAHPVAPTEPIQPSEPTQPAPAQAVTPPRKSKAKAAVEDVPAKSLIDTQALVPDMTPTHAALASTNANTSSAKKPARAKKPKMTENESV